TLHLSKEGAYWRERRMKSPLHLPMKSLVHVLLGTAAVATLVALPAGPAAAEKSLKECNQEYALRQAVVEAANETKSNFMAECRTRGTGEPTPIAASGRTP